MKSLATTVLLLTAIVLPVVLLWLLVSRSLLGSLPAAAIAVTTGWVLNVGWAYASQRVEGINSSEASRGTLSIALRYGWICPTVLVVITWLIWHFKGWYGA